MAAHLHSADLFSKLSSFMRYLLDDVLMPEVYNDQGVMTDTLENLVVECDSLMTSLNNFKKKTEIIPSKEAAPCIGSQISNGSSGTSENHEYFKFTELCEYITKKLITLTSLIKFKPCYCKICDVATWFEHVFHQHCTSKKHIQQTNQTSEQLTVFHCKVCSLSLIAPQSEISSITSLRGHSLLDEHVKKIKASGKDEDYIKEDQRENISDASEEGVKTDTTEIVYVPPKVKQLFQMIKKRMKSGTDLSETVPHYCHVCEVMATSLCEFIDHTSSKKHISALNSATNSINVYKCEKCGFLITGYQTGIDSIINSSAHRDLDESVGPLKDKEPGKDVNKIFVPNSAEASGGNTVLAKENTISQLSRADIQYAIKYFLGKLKSLSDLQKFAPAYCFTCMKLLFSGNDFRQHLASRKHVQLVSSNASSVYVHSCATCLISIYGTDIDIKNALDLPEHVNLHKKIHSLSSVSNLSKNSTDQDTVKQNSLVSDKTVRSESDSKKKLMVEEKLPTLNQNKNSSPPIDLEEKSALSKRIDKGIPDKFLTINSKLQCGNFTKSGFCRPCKKGINITKGWAYHLSCSRHKKAIDKTPFENIPISCKYCPLQILGDQVFGNVCMDIHLKLNHLNYYLSDAQNDVPVVIKKEICEENSDVTTPGASFEQNKTVERLLCNDDTSINVQNSSKSTVIKKEISEENTDVTPGASFEQNKTVERLLCKHDTRNNGQNSSKATSIKVEKLLSSSITQTPFFGSPQEFLFNFQLSEQSSQGPSTTLSIQNNCLEVFTKFLEKRKQVFLNEGLKQFGAMCLLCTQTFEDYYNWLIHLKDPCHKSISNDVIEKECSNCNLSLYGRKVIIEKEFWSLEEHVSLDILFTK